MSEMPTGTATRLLREVVIDLSIMTAIGVVLALLGPFGSFELPLAHRLVYWIGLGWAGYACYRPVGSLVVGMGERLHLPAWGSWTGTTLIATVPMAAFVWCLGFIGRDLAMPTLEQAVTTYAYVLLVGAGVTLLFNLIERREAPSAGPHASSLDAVDARAGSAPFLDRLPPELGSNIIALEMEDHYVRVHTSLGSGLVLMRLRDAIAELGGIEGMQVHRSWWVARGAVADVQRDGRKVRLMLDNGIEAPVSRANVAVLREAGWI